MLGMGVGLNSRGEGPQLTEFKLLVQGMQISLDCSSDLRVQVVSNVDVISCGAAVLMRTVGGVGKLSNFGPTFCSAVVSFFKGRYK